MQPSPDLSASALPELVEGLSVKKEAPTTTHITPISPSFPAIQLQPMTPIPTQYLPNTRQKPTPSPICMTGNDWI